MNSKIFLYLTIATSIVHCKLDYCNSLYYMYCWRHCIALPEHPELSCSYCHHTVNGGNTWTANCYF